MPIIIMVSLCTFVERWCIPFGSLPIELTCKG